MAALNPNAPDCEEVVRALWDYLDRRLKPQSLSAIDEHLARCDGCRAHAEFEAQLVRELSALRRRHSNPARLRSDVLRVLRGAGMGEGDTR